MAPSLLAVAAHRRCGGFTAHPHRKILVLDIDLDFATTMEPEGSPEREENPSWNIAKLRNEKN